MRDLPAFHLTVVYAGDSRLLDPARINGISSTTTDGAVELGVDDTILESYVDSWE